jgi:hypothetical protein
VSSLLIALCSIIALSASEALTTGDQSVKALESRQFHVHER